MLIWYDLILPYSWRTFWLAKYPPFPLRKPTQLLGKNMGKTPLLERSWWKAPALAFSTPSGPLTAAARWLAMQWDSQVRLVGLGHGIWPQMAKNWKGHRWWTGDITISWWWDKGWYRQKKLLMPSAETEFRDIGHGYSLYIATSILLWTLMDFKDCEMPLTCVFSFAKSRGNGLSDLGSRGGDVFPMIIESHIDGYFLFDRVPTIIQENFSHFMWSLHELLRFCWCLFCGSFSWCFSDALALAGRFLRVEVLGFLWDMLRG